MYTGTIIEYNKYSKVAQAVVMTNEGEEVVVPVTNCQGLSLGDDVQVSEEQVQGAIIDRDVQDGIEEQPKYWWQRD